MVETPVKSAWDYFAVKNRDVLALVEIKCRRNAHDKYPTYMISTEKIHRCLSRSWFTGIPFWLIVAFTDQTMLWIANDGSDVGHTLGGRWDRGDQQDIELVTHIPMEQFTAIPARGRIQ